MFELWEGAARSRQRKSIVFAVTSLAVGALVACSSPEGGADRLLFGATITDNISPAVSCASEIAVTPTMVDLIEDGDVNRSYNTVDPYFTDADTDGGVAWGLRSSEFCIYPMLAFTGTVTVPISTNGSLAGRTSIASTFPVASNPLPASLSFTGDGVTGHGTAARQCFRVTRVDDGIRNPVESALVVSLGAITSGDDNAVYTGKNPCDVNISMEDDEGPGVRVSNISRIMEEPGGTGFSNASFSVRLRTAPTSNVTIPINDIYDATNAGHREGTAGPASLTFTNANFATPQAVTINSADDLEVDGTKTYTVEVQTTSSADSQYNGIKPRNVVVINNDKSVPGYTYTLWDTSTGNATGSVTGFATDEQNNFGTNYSSFRIKLRSKPSSNVTLNFATSKASVSTIQTPTLTFTPSNWNVDQWVLVNGKSDSANGGNQDYDVSFTVTTTDPTYTVEARPSFRIRSCDNDVANLIQPCNFSGSPMGTAGERLSGAEPSATNYIWLITQASPGSAVTVPLSSTDTTEGTVPASVTIDSSNYNTMGANANRIALTHVDDTLLDGPVNWTVTTGLSGGGLSFDPLDVFATTTDNEQYYYIDVSGSTNESDTVTATISICLGATNADNVQINAACSGDECGSVSPANVTFTPGQVITAGTPSNAACASDPNRLTFTVHGADDAFADGTQTFTVNLSLTTTDSTYSGHPPSNQTISNADNESPGKAVFVPGISFVGEMTAAGVGGADNYCTTNKPAYAPAGTYKALIVSDSATNRRMATTTGTDATGQVGWVLTPNYYYYRCTGSGTSCDDEHQHLFIANSAGLIPFPMSRDFTGNAADQFWTGMNVNMTAATQTMTPAKVDVSDPDYRDNCAGWTYQNGPTNPFPAYYGQTWQSDGSSGVNSNTNVACTTSRKLICVQQ
ncbi:MAG: DUF1554 domain-containing protein [Leptospirales bacterium]|nr:DUF1554 domain-containing protein [Leptospirales bacterium]